MYSEKTIGNLPLDALTELMIAAVGELLDAEEKNDHLAVKAKQKQLDIIYAAIKRKRRDEKRS